MSNETVQILISGLISLGGLVIAAITIFFNQKNKIEPFKKKMYDTQISACFECLDALSNLQLTIEKNYNYLNQPETIGNYHNRKSFIESTEEKANELKLLLLRWVGVLPQEIYFPLVNYLSVVEYASAKRFLLNGWAGSSISSFSPWEECVNFYLLTIKEIRKFLGVEPLSININKENGKKKNSLSDLDDELLPIAYILSNDYRPHGAYQDGYIRIANPTLSDKTFKPEEQ